MSCVERKSPLAAPARIVKLNPGKQPGANLVPTVADSRQRLTKLCSGTRPHCRSAHSSFSHCSPESARPLLPVNVSAAEKPATFFRETIVCVASGYSSKRCGTTGLSKTRQSRPSCSADSFPIWRVSLWHSLHGLPRVWESRRAAEGGVSWRQSSLVTRAPFDLASVTPWTRLPISEVSGALRWTKTKCTRTT